MKSRPPTVMVICADPALTERVVQELSLIDSRTQTPLAGNIAQGLHLLDHYFPDVILLDESALGSHSTPLDESIAPLTERAPLVFSGHPAKQEFLAVLIGSGALDMVARVGNFTQVVVGLIERRLRQAEIAEVARLDFESGETFGETLRHEVNNPLTGILGNAQMLLARARRENLQPNTLERLQTIADLAMRLRETVRVLSQNWEDAERSQSRARDSSEIRP